MTTPLRVWVADAGAGLASISFRFPLNASPEYTLNLQYLQLPHSRERKELEDHFNLGLFDDEGLDMLADALDAWRTR
jgi:hypothetical protein